MVRASADIAVSLADTDFGRDNIVTGDEVPTGLANRSARAGFPSLNQRIFAPFKLATVIDAVARRGIAPDTVLDRTGLALSQVRDPPKLPSIGQYLLPCDKNLEIG